MELQVTQENINKAFSSVSRVASSRGTLPILSNVLVKTTGNRLSISATNLDIAVTHYIGSKVKNEGSITIPAKLTHDFISSLPTGVVDIKLNDNKLYINTEKFESVINGISSDEFPVMPTINNGKEWHIPSKKLKTSLGQVIGSASSDESRPVLTGVYIYSSENNLFIVATDSYRLAEKTVQEVENEINVLVPASAMQELLRILGDYSGEVVIISDEQQILFKVGEIELVARLIEGSYPDYKKLIPQKFETTAIVKKEDFVNITKVSSLFARESAGSVNIQLNSEDNTISIHSIASQLGENTATADAKIKGQGSITLNSRYILDALSACEGEEIEFSFNGKLEPCVIRNPKKKDYLHIIMPLKS
ncbi:DNA polymerase III subunit beta [Candidatus Saccharibacteria bacterium]|nr:DNA polymerase III subunit beta [Candidatus Saccharibacteria bacterium]